MTYREKVKKGLKFCLALLDSPCEDCPYYSYEDIQDFDCERNLLHDALALLKEQEPVTIKKTLEHGFGVYGGICPKCHNWIQSAHSFCGFCGQAVKWDEQTI